MNGFTIVELLVGLLLISIAFTGSAMVLMSGNRSLQTARMDDRSEALIDDDVARMNELSTRLTCCDGTCTTSPSANIPPPTDGCLPANPGDQEYYYPVIKPSVVGLIPFLEDPATGQCNNGGIGDAMISEMNSDGNAPDADFTATGLSRTAERVDSSDDKNHLVRLTYSLDSESRRVVYVLPPAAAWCP
jgi:prepilin-type N-terminal cleavage/methylation domain-containing protein